MSFKRGPALLKWLMPHGQRNYHSGAFDSPTKCVVAIGYVVKQSVDVILLV